MTRLTVNDIHHIPQALKAYDERVRQQTGTDLLGLACHAIGADPLTIGSRLSGFRIAAVPSTCGEGVLGGFCESLVSIAAHLGCRARITPATDVSGFADAFESGEDGVLCADENRFVAIDLHTRFLADNGRATGAGFAAALDLMAGGIKGREAVVMGCGPVGTSAARALTHFGARVIFSDPDASKRRAVIATQGIEAADALDDPALLPHTIRQAGLVLEATNSAATVSPRDLTSDTLVAAPGIPLGLTPEAATVLGPRLYHDPLETGTAVMLAMLAASRQDR